MKTSKQYTRLFFGYMLRWSHCKQQQYQKYITLDYALLSKFCLCRYRCYRRFRSAWSPLPPNYRRPPLWSTLTPPPPPRPPSFPQTTLSFRALVRSTNIFIFWEYFYANYYGPDVGMGDWKIWEEKEAGDRRKLHHKRVKTPLKCYRQLNCTIYTPLSKEIISGTWKVRLKFERK